MKWWNDKLYLLDLGMIGELEPEVREMMLLLLLSFWQEDADFLAQLVLMLGGEKHTAQGFDMEAFRGDLAGVIQKYRAVSLRELQIGPMLQDVTTIAVRHNVRLPASLALTGKAFAQMQLAAAELDPTLDPLAVAGSFVFKYTIQQLGRGIAPGNLLLESRKARLRISRIFGAVETAMGATPGDRLQLDFGADRIGASVAVAARRLAIALAATGAIVGTAMTVSSPRVARWVPGLMGSLGAALTAGLLADIARRQK